MRLVDTGPDAGRAASEHGSHDVRIVPLHGPPGGPPYLVMIHFRAGGILGRHPATAPQLFVVVAGNGWVSGDDAVRRPIATGQAAFWIGGEEHESGTELGMTAVVLETTDAGDPRGLFGRMLGGG